MTVRRDTKIDQTKILLKASWQGWLNELKHQPQRKYFLKAIGYLIFILVLSVLGNEIFASLRMDEAPPALVFTVINGFILFGSVIVAKELMETSLNVLYEAADSVLLRSLPIPQVVIFGVKFVQMTGTRFLTLLCLLGPPWVALGQIFELPWHFYVTLVPACFCLLLLIASYVTICMMVIARFFSSGQLLSTLKMLATAVSVAVGFLVGFMLLVPNFEVGFDLLQIKQFFLKWASTRNVGVEAELLGTAWYPHQWLGRLMFSWIDESAGARMQYGALLIAGSFMSVCLTVLLAIKIYPKGWENILCLQSKRVWHRTVKRVTRTTGLFSFARGTFLQRVRAMMLKDFTVFIRHRGGIIGIVMLTLFLIVHIGVLLARGSVEDVNDALTLSVQIMIYSILITFRLSCRGFYDEAKTWWMLKVTPVTPELAYTSKFLTGLLCAFIYTEFWTLIALNLLQIPVNAWLPFLLTPVLSLSAVCALNTAIGTLPWMAELNFRARSQPLLRALTFMLTILADLVLISGPMITLHIGEVAWLGVVSVCIAGGLALFYKIGIRNLRKLLAAQS